MPILGIIARQDITAAFTFDVYPTPGEQKAQTHAKRCYRSSFGIARNQRSCSVFGTGQQNPV
jgi:hypothetical protein